MAHFGEPFLLEGSYADGARRLGRAHEVSQVARSKKWRPIPSFALMPITAAPCRAFASSRLRVSPVAARLVGRAGTTRASQCHRTASAHVGRSTGIRADHQGHHRTE